MITHATNFSMQRLTGLCRQGCVYHPQSLLETEQSLMVTRTRTVAPGLSSAQVSREMFNAPAQSIRIHTYSPAQWSESVLRNKIERSRHAKLVVSSAHNQ